MGLSERTTAINATLLVLALVLAFCASPLARESYSLTRYSDFTHRVERYSGLALTTPVCSYSLRLRQLQETMLADYSPKAKEELVNFFHKNDIASKKNVYDFNDDDITWILALASLEYYVEIFRPGDFVRPRDVAMLATAAHAYQAIGRHSAARDLFHFAVQLYDEPTCDQSQLESIIVTCYDALAIMSELYRINEATVRYARKLLSLNSSSQKEFRTRWYTQMMAAQHSTALKAIKAINGDVHQANAIWDAYIEANDKDAQACLVESENTDQAAFACAHTHYLNEMWRGNLESTTRGLLRAHERIAMSAYNPQTRIRGQAKHMSLAFEHARVPEFLPYAGVSVVDVDQTTATRFFNPEYHSRNGDICSAQVLPYYLDNGEVKHSNELFEEILCLDDSVKRMELFRVEQGTVAGKAPVVRSREGGVIFPGYEHASSLNNGIITVAEEAAFRMLPQIDIKRAVVCHMITSNYFHLVVETAAKFAYAYHHFSLTDPDNLPVALIIGTPASVQLVKMMGIPEELVEIYMPANIYAVDELYVVGYPWEQDPDGPIVFHHSELFYVPPAVGLLSSRDVMISQNPLIKKDVKPFRVLFSHRSAGDRRHRFINDMDTLYARLEAVCAEFPGVEWGVFKPVSVAEQQQLFHEALVVMSPHGAGLTNILFCQEGTAVLELPCTPRKASVYAQMARMLKLEYWTVPSAIANHFSYYVLSEESIQSLEDTLRHLLTART